MHSLRFYQYFFRVAIILSMIGVIGYLNMKAYVVEGAEKSTSKATIEFVPTTDQVIPMNPKNPTEALDSTYQRRSSTANIEKGELRLDYVAMPNFVTDRTSLYHEANKLSSDVRFIQISNLASMNSTWMVTAKMNEVKSQATNEVIPEAELILDNSELSSISQTDSPKMNQAISLHADGEQVPIVYAAPGTGRGIWLQHWPEEGDVANQSSFRFESLTSNAHTKEQIKDVYQTEITWTLTSAPTEPE